MISILFVDDDPNVGAGLRRTLRRMRGVWDMRFAESGPQALAMMDQEPVDLIVTDMRMPDMDGAQLLGEVERRHPQTVRIILSGQCDRRTALSAVGPTHLFLAKPYDSEQLIEVVERVYRLRAILAGTRLTAAVSGLRGLPSSSAIQHELLAALRSPDASLQSIAEIVERDIALTAKLLQLVNSAFFGAHWRATTALQAVHLLGTELVQTLVLTFGIMNQLEQKRSSSMFDRCLQHGMKTASSARFIASDLKLPKRGVDEAFTAGLLHDIGLLILSSALAEEDREITRLCEAEGGKRWDIERRQLGATHAEMGAYLLALWGFPDAIIEATAFHHDPQKSGSQISVTTAVHVASALTSGGDEPLDIEYLEEVGAIGHLAAWKHQIGTLAIGEMA
jgi:HD-like signal output (HDOD) protein